jgi:hypothetical protein
VWLLHDMKRCSRCGETKPLDRFYRYTGRCKHKPGTPHAACKDCEFADRNARRKADPEGAAVVARRAKLKRLFGITPEDYDAMFARQGGVCAICRRTSPDGRRLHVDHCHNSKRVRGLLCHDCNRGIGMFRDLPGLLRTAADYVEAD